MFKASTCGSDRTASRTRPTRDARVFSPTRLPGGTTSKTTGVDPRRSRNGARIVGRMGEGGYLNVRGRGCAALAALEDRRPDTHRSIMYRLRFSSRGEGLVERFRRRSLPFSLHDILLRDASPQELGAISERLALALSVDEMQRIQAYFRAAGRDPTDVELQSLGQAWSEHCCYKSSKVFLKEFIFPVQAPYVIDRGDAGVVEFDADHAYALRIESHNHPSAVEPYGGATTGIGGILRDVLAMGAQPVALCDPLHFGPLDLSSHKLPRGTKHPRYLFGGVVSRIRAYGNRAGIPP